MKQIKQILGFLGVIFGVLGVVLCLAVIVGAWWVNNPIKYTLLYRVFPPIELALDFGDEKVNEFATFITDIEQQFNNTTAKTEPLAAALENEIEQVAVYIEVAQSAADSVSDLAGGLVATAETDESRPVVALAASQLETTLGNTTQTLNQVATLTQQIGEGRTDRIEALNEQFDTLQSETAEVQAALDQTETEVATIKSKIPRWINLGSLLVTLIFVWFGVAQYYLIRVSWQQIRPRWFTEGSREQTVHELTQQIEQLQGQLNQFKTTINQPE